MEVHCTEGGVADWFAWVFDFQGMHGVINAQRVKMSGISGNCDMSLQ